MNNVIGDITGIGGCGILRRLLLILREVSHAGTFSKRIIVDGVGCGGCGGGGSSGEFNAENHDAVFTSTSSSVVACSRVVAVVAAV
jgi:hypothetical protein